MIAVMIGRIITASTMPATNMVRPVLVAGPLKNGMKPRCAASHFCSPTDAGPSTTMPQRP